MIRYSKMLNILALTLISAQCLPKNTYGKTTFRNRSEGFNTLIQQLGTVHFTNPYDIDYLNGYIGVSASYDSSFDKDEIGKYFFFNGTNTMRVSNNTIVPDGTGNANVLSTANPGVDIYSENLFLNNNATAAGALPFNSIIKAFPKVQNACADFNLRLNLDEWVSGLYFDVHAPINWTRWNMNIKEQELSVGTSIIARTLGNPAAIGSPVKTVKAALEGQTLDIVNFPDLKQPLLYGKVNGAQTKTRLADVESALGYTIVGSEYGHIALELRVIFPTGTVPSAEYWFEPLVGNGHQYGFGGGTTAHYELWNNEIDSSLSVWALGKIYHMFGARQRRIFDLNNADGTQNIGSSRLLIKKFTGLGVLSEILYGPNVLALHCKVHNDIQSQATILFDYQREGFTLDVGYQFWARTKDKITVTQDIAPNTYAIKGVTSGNGGANPEATASNTTINGASVADATQVFISNSSINVSSAEQPNALSHTAFFHINYAWEFQDYTPFIGCGSQLELSGSSNNALDLWGAWIKIGFSFS